MTRKRILLADDHTMLCDLLKELLQRDYQVAGYVDNGRDLLKAVTPFDQTSSFVTMEPIHV